MKEKTKTATAIANKLKKLHQESALSQKHVAFELGVDEGTISRWLNGETVPSADMIPALARVYKVPIACLFLPAGDGNAQAGQK